VGVLDEMSVISLFLIPYTYIFINCPQSNRQGKFLTGYFRKIETITVFSSSLFSNIGLDSWDYAGVYLLFISAPRGQSSDLHDDLLKHPK
jgi:hypothetical protein